MSTRVLVVETTLFGYDGITNVVTNYYTYQDHNRIKMDFVTINPVSENFKIILDENDSVNYVLPYRNSNPVKYAFELAKILRHGKYKILHVHGNSATMAVEMFAALISGVKVRIAHSHNTKCDHIKADKLLRPFFKLLYTHGFACGKEAGEWLFPGKSFEIISNGVDLAKFCYDEQIRREFRSEYGFDDCIAVGHVGRFSEQKNHSKLIDIFKTFSEKHENAKLVLVGDGELRKQIEDKTKRLGLDVLYVGLSDEVEKWLQAVDIIVFPSLYEGLPLGLVEAQSAGLPCVLSNTISPMTRLTDLVEFVDLNADDSVWCKKVSEMMESRNRISDGASAIKSIRESGFDIRRNCDELAELYEKIAERAYN